MNKEKRVRRFVCIAALVAAGLLGCSDVVIDLNNLTGAVQPGTGSVDPSGGGGGTPTPTGPVPEGMVSVRGATITGVVADSKVFWAASITVVIDDFWMCDHEVTQDEWETVMGNNPSYFKGDAANGEVQENRPVEMVTWYDAIVYCNRRSMREGLEPCYSIDSSTNPDDWGDAPVHNSGEKWDVGCDFAKNGYRLPKQEEWEYAARGGKGLAGTQTTYAGSDDVGAVAWFKDNSDGKTHEVKKKAANTLGLFDMSGNVSEWCWDYAPGYITNIYLINYGGGLRGDADSCKVSYRSSSAPTYCYYDLGFRVVRSTM